MLTYIYRYIYGHAHYHYHAAGFMIFLLHSIIFYCCIVVGNLYFIHRIATSTAMKL